MDKQPTEARQDELAGIREKIAKAEFELVLYLAHEHGFTVSAYTWEELELKFKEYYYYRADQILSLTVSSGGGVCPECKGEGGWPSRQDDPEPPTECLKCGGTGRTKVVEKTLLEWVKLGMEASK